jgi:hypothetical protein
MGLNDLFSLLTKYGIKDSFMVLLLSLFFFYLRNKHINFKDLMIRIKKIFSNKKNITDSDISNHDIFNYIDLWIFSKIPTLIFFTEYRTVIFKKYLTIYLKVYKDNIQKFISSKDYQNMDNSELWKSFLKLINDTVYDYEKEMSQEGIPFIIIDKMKMKMNDSIILSIDLMENICNNNFYESDKNYLKVFSILSILLAILDHTIINSEEVCNSINGQLKGLEYTENNKVYKEI